MTILTAWRSAPTGPPQTPGLATAAAALGFLSGGTTNGNYMGDATYKKYAANDYTNGVVISELGEWRHIQPTQGGAVAPGMITQEGAMFPPGGVTWMLHLVYSLPTWVSTAVTSAATATSVLQTYINGLAAAIPYPTTQYITLVNESINTFNGDGYVGSGYTTPPPAGFTGFVPNIFKGATSGNQSNYLGNSFKSGYIATMYTMCRKAFGPLVKLGLNFDNVEASAAQMKQLLWVYQQFYAAGIHLDYFGNESHLNDNQSVDLATLDYLYRGLANLGVDIYVTELDCNDKGATVNVATRDAAYVTQIQNAVTVAANCRAVKMIMPWADNDRYNWEVFSTGWPNSESSSATAPNFDPNKASGVRAGQAVGRNDGVLGRPSLLDFAYRPKSAYAALLTAMTNAARVGAAPGMDCFITFGQASNQFSLATGLPSATALGTVTVATLNGSQTFNEPAGYTVVADTGPLTVQPAQTQNGTWETTGGTQPIIPTMFSPGGAQPAPGTSGYSTGWAGNLQLTSTSDPSSTGYRIFYPVGIASGTTPVNWGFAVSAAATTNSYYFRWRQRSSASYTNNGNVTTKLFFFNTSTGPSNNFLAAGWDANTRGTHLWAALGIQPSPGATYDSEAGGTGSLGQAAGDVSGGQWHWVEWLIQNATPGQSVATVDCWVDDVHVDHAANALIFPASDAGIVNFILFQSTYGGGTNRPPASAQPMWIDIDQLHISFG